MSFEVILTYLIAYLEISYRFQSECENLRSNLAKHMDPDFSYLPDDAALLDYLPGILPQADTRSSMIFPDK